MAPLVFLSRQMLVLHETPSTTARTGVRPHGLVTGGASACGIRANVHPPFPGYRTSSLVNGPRCSTDDRRLLIGQRRVTCECSTCKGSRLKANAREIETVR